MQFPKFFRKSEYVPFQRRNKMGIGETAIAVGTVAMLSLGVGAVVHNSIQNSSSQKKVQPVDPLAQLFAQYGLPAEMRTTLHASALNDIHQNGIQDLAYLVKEKEWTSKDVNQLNWDNTSLASAKTLADTGITTHTLYAIEHIPGFQPKYSASLASTLDKNQIEDLPQYREEYQLTDRLTFIKNDIDSRTVNAYHDTNPENILLFQRHNVPANYANECNVLNQEFKERNVTITPNAIIQAYASGKSTEDIRNIIVERLFIKELFAQKTVE